MSDDPITVVEVYTTGGMFLVKATEREVTNLRRLGGADTILLEVADRGLPLELRRGAIVGLVVRGTQDA